MLLTFFTVALPESHLELRNCLETVYRFGPELLDWVLVTEPEHVPALREIVGPWHARGVRVEGMRPEAMAIRKGYFRQMMAKMQAHRYTAAEQIVITDDDTEAIADWSPARFFDEHGRARVWYRRNPVAFWCSGSLYVFGKRSPRNFQLKIPFAIRREVLEDLERSARLERCLTCWKRNELLSEFMVMGEAAWLDPLREERTVFVSGVEGHPVLGREACFDDWQGFRRDLRKAILRRRGFDTKARSNAPVPQRR